MEIKVEPWEVDAFHKVADELYKLGWISDRAHSQIHRSISKFQMNYFNELWKNYYQSKLH